MSAKKTSMHNYIALLKIEDMNVGGVYENELHCSLVLWFKTTANRDELIRVCNSVLRDRKPVALKAIGTEDFGKKSPLLATLIEKNGALAKMHNDMIDELEKLPGFSLFEPQFSRDAWRPHVTFQNNRSLKENEVVVTSSVYLVEASGDPIADPKHVFAEVKFGHETTA